MRDSFGREVHDLRISITDRCNLRCVYCMPAEGVQFTPNDRLLHLEEIVLVVQAAASLGVRKIRLTGGEPTVHPHLLDLVRQIADVPGIKDVAMTTNGLRLSRLSTPLARAGLKRVNVSLDTLNAERFHRITRRGQLEDVWAGILAAEDAGLRPIKLNAVVVRGFNENDVVDLAALTVEHDWEMRFIEVMPFSEVGSFAKEEFVSNDETRSRIEERFGPLLALDDGEGPDPARPYKIKGARGAIGFISPVGKPFCARCGRLRLTSDGKLRLCLLRDDEIDLMTPLRQGADLVTMQELIKSGILRKPWGHDLAHDVFPQQRFMVHIGG
jgi:GTP 3',8-cyclase